MERSHPLSKLEIPKYKAVLEEEYAELIRVLPPRDTVTVDRMPDPIDEAIQSSDRAVEARALEANSILLREVIAALRRTQSGDYGTCAGCARQISQKRLDAIPWTPLCINCQEEQEQQPVQALRDAA